MPPDRPIADPEHQATPPDERRDELTRLQQLAAVGHTAAGISHEVRNLLGGILGLAQLARTELLPVATAEQGYFEAIERDALRGIELLGGFLELARLPTHDHAPVAVAALIADVTAVVKQPLRLKQITLTVDVEPGLAAVHGDAVELGQVLLNLLLNATDATPTGGRIVVTAASADGGQVELVVADSGAGVATALQQKIFEPFFTTKPRGEGSGLGLAYCKQVVEAHGGTIAATAGTVGARLVVRLPAAAGEGR